MGLFESIKLPISDFHAQKVRMIDEFDYSNLRWKVKEELGEIATEEYLDKGIENLKKYYAVALIDPINQHAVSEEVDPFWHTHILFTREYVKFCDSIFNQFIHHEPLDRKDPEEVTRVTDLYDYTIDVYNKIFRDNDKFWWPDSTSASFQAICYHNSLYDPEILENGMFPSKN